MIGNRIQRARKALGLSSSALGKHTALSHAEIKKYEDNEATPSSDILIKLAKALHVRVGYFFRPEYLTLVKIQYHKHSKSHPIKRVRTILELKGAAKKYGERQSEVITNEAIMKQIVLEDDQTK